MSDPWPPDPIAQQRAALVQEAADWAENAMVLKPNSDTALRGADAAAYGRATLDRANAPIAQR